MEIISIYNKEEKKKTLEELEEIIEGEGWKKMIVEGDFNARTAETGTDRTCMGRRRGKRYSKDKIMNKQGIDLLEKIEKMGLGLLMETRKATTRENGHSQEQKEVQ